MILSTASDLRLIEEVVNNLAKSGITIHLEDHSLRVKNVLQKMKVKGQINDFLPVRRKKSNKVIFAVVIIHKNKYKIVELEIKDSKGYSVEMHKSNSKRYIIKFGPRAKNRKLRSALWFLFKKIKES